jgi:DNA topoisomerase-1
MTAPTLTFEQALKLLSLPRVIGVDPADGVAITAQNGRFGPYIQKGTESRSLETEDQIFSYTVEEALALLAKPKDRRRRAAAPPLRELGNDPVSQKPIVLREGRFGPYVTDGETVASLRKGDTIEGITPERAQELLVERRERGPSTGRRGRRGRFGAARGAPKAKKAPKAEVAVAAAGAEGEAAAAKPAKKKAAKKKKRAAKAKAAAPGAPKPAAEKKPAEKKAKKKAAAEQPETPSSAPPAIEAG